VEVLEEIENKLKPEEVSFIKGKLEASDKKTLTLFKCYKMTKDQGDLINSL